MKTGLAGFFLPGIVAGWALNIETDLAGLGHRNRHGQFRQGKPNSVLFFACALNFIAVNTFQFLVGARNLLALFNLHVGTFFFVSTATLLNLS